MAFSHLPRPCLTCASATVPFAKLLFVQKPEGGGGKPRPSLPPPGTSLAGTCSQIPAPGPSGSLAQRLANRDRRFPGSPRGRAGVPPQHCRKWSGLCASPTPTVLPTSALPPHSRSPELRAPRRLPLSPESGRCGVFSSGFPNSISQNRMRAPNSSTPPLPPPTAPILPRPVRRGCRKSQGLRHRFCKVGRGLGREEMALEEMGPTVPHSGCCLPAWGLVRSFLPTSGGDQIYLQGLCCRRNVTTPEVPNTVFGT